MRVRSSRTRPRPHRLHRAGRPAGWALLAFGSAVAFAVALALSCTVTSTAPAAPSTAATSSSWWSGADPAPTEAPVKAAIVLNLTKFVQWPDSTDRRAQGQLTLLIVGSDPVADAIDAMADSLTGNSRFPLEHHHDLRRLRDADIVYLAASEHSRFGEILRQIGDRPVLTVSNLPDFARHGGICSFRPREEKVGLEINLDRAKAVGLRISSKVLALSTIVSDQR